MSRSREMTDDDCCSTTKLKDSAAEENINIQAIGKPHSPLKDTLATAELLHRELTGETRQERIDRLWAAELAAQKASPIVW